LPTCGSLKGVSSPRRRFWRIVLLLAALGVAVILIAVALTLPVSSQTARLKLIAVLEDQLDADVSLADFQFRLWPRLRAEGSGLVIRHRNRPGIPPMIAIERFAAEGDVFGLMDRHIASVVVDRMDIEIPPDVRSKTPGTANDIASRVVGAPRSISRDFVVDQL